MKDTKDGLTEEQAREILREEITLWSDAHVTHLKGGLIVEEWFQNPSRMKSTPPRVSK